jgi:hypothetical protein
VQDDVLRLAFEVHRATEEKIDVIDALTRRTRVLSLNARIEASRAGEHGAAFAVVAQEMSDFASEVAQLAAELREVIATNTEQIRTAGEDLAHNLLGARYADMSRNVVEIMDRNLYERSCDVRWWATDSAIVDAAGSADRSVHAWASERLATILRSYTVYLDLWVADINGKVVAQGRGGRYGGIIGQDVSRSQWFRRALETPSGDAFAVCDIARERLLEDAAVAVYSTAIRRNGDTQGTPIGALGIFFDWEPQARDVVQNVALTDEEKTLCSIMLLDAQHKIIATSDGNRRLGEQYELGVRDPRRGFYRRDDSIISYALTPGYETYKGLGWYGCIESKVQGIDTAAQARRATG